MTVLRSPIRWFGGKGKMVDKLLKFVPNHHTYCEVFGGGASLLMRKQPAQVEIYNDLDSGLVNLFRVLRDEEQCRRLQELLALTPYSREEYYYWRKEWASREDPVERAYGFYLVSRQSFGGRFASGWGYDKTFSAEGRASSVSNWLWSIEQLPQIHERLFRCQIEHDDFRKILPRYDTNQTFFYCDPSYIETTRRSGKYSHEMSIEDHGDLIRILSKLEGMVLLSGYQNEINACLENIGWERKDFETSSYAAGRTRQTGLKGKGAILKHQKRIESVWLNPQLQEALRERSAE